MTSPSDHRADGAPEPRWRMPHEGDPHERTWMAWPTGGYTLGDTLEEAEEARDAWAAVANAVAGAEPVTMLVDPSQREHAVRRLASEVELVDCPLDDAWMRDIGPSFAVREREDGSRELGAVCWRFNGWGQQAWASWRHDAEVGRIVSELAGATCVDASIVNEGGGIQVDGEGTVLLTRTVQLDPGRNPGASEAEIEAGMARTIGAETAIWLSGGLARDSEEFGTRGHVDLVAAFAEPGRVLVHEQRDDRHPDHRIAARLRAELEAARDARGRALELLPLPAPRQVSDAEGWVDWSYVNHLVANGMVIACAFDDPADAEAAAILREAYPGREIVAVDARPLFARGGGIHCITQQQPKVERSGPRTASRRDDAAPGPREPIPPAPSSCGSPRARRGTPASRCP